MSFHDQLYFFKKNPGIFIKSMYFSVPIQILTPIIFWVTAKAFNCQTEIIYFLILVPIVMIVTLIPITIAGLGTGQVAAVAFFHLIGIDKNVSANISLLNSAFTIALGLLGGIFYVAVSHRKLPATHAKETV